DTLCLGRNPLVKIHLREEVRAHEMGNRPLHEITRERACGEKHKEENERGIIKTSSFSYAVRNAEEYKSERHELNKQRIEKERSLAKVPEGTFEDGKFYLKLLFEKTETVMNEVVADVATHSSSVSF